MAKLWTDEVFWWISMIAMALISLACLTGCAGMQTFAVGPDGIAGTPDDGTGAGPWGIVFGLAKMGLGLVGGPVGELGYSALMTGLGGMYMIKHGRAKKALSVTAQALDEQIQAATPETRQAIEDGIRSKAQKIGAYKYLKKSVAVMRQNGVLKHK